jgi:hypothetical protein
MACRRWWDSLTWCARADGSWTSKRLAQPVKAFLQQADRAFHGRWAGCIDIALGVWLFYFAFRGLPWGALPNVLRFILSCWLTLLIRGAIIYYGALSIATRRETPHEMLGWIAGGIAWKLLKFILPIFIDWSDLLIIYRRGRTGRALPTKIPHCAAERLVRKRKQPVMPNRPRHE